MFGRPSSASVVLDVFSLVFFRRKKADAEVGIRTPVGTKPLGPEPNPFGRSGTSAKIETGTKRPAGKFKKLCNPGHNRQKEEQDASYGMDCFDMEIFDDPLANKD